MKSIKPVVLAFVAATAILAFVGTTTASAIIVKKTVACKVKEEPCKAGNIFAKGLKMKGQLKKGTEGILATSVGTIKCKSGFAEGESLEEKGTKAPSEGGAYEIEGRVTKSTLGECTLGSTACTVTMTNLPWTNLTKWTGIDTGVAKIPKPKEGAEPGGKVVCGFFVNCVFTTNNAKETIHGGEPATGEVNNVFLEKKEGSLCPKEATLSGQYEVTEPNPIHISYVEEEL